MFTPEQILQFQLLIQQIQFRPLRLEQQELQRKDGYAWCVDWWTIEVLKCLMHGDVVYLGDPPPNRLKDNPLFSKEHVLRWTAWKRRTYEFLKANRAFSTRVLICEVGRGLEILLASFCESWSEIIAYDNNPFMLQEVTLYFSEKLHIPLQLSQICTEDYDFTITQPTLVVANSTRISDEWLVKLAHNPNVRMIHDGEPCTPEYASKLFGNV